MYLLPGHTPTGLHEATDVVIDLVFDEADAGAHANGLRQVWLEMARPPVEPGIKSAAPNIESGRSFTDGDDPQRRMDISVQVRTSRSLLGCERYRSLQDQ